jgi:ABC-type arginine transport system permease subunit
MLYRASATVLKIALASLVVGVVLSSLNVTAEQVLTDLGLTPEEVLEWMNTGVDWAVPNILLGSFIIVPVWIIVYLFRPPRS